MITKYHPRMSLELINSLARGKMINYILETQLKISKSTFRRWRLQNQEFKNAYNLGMNLSALYWLELYKEAAQ